MNSNPPATPTKKILVVDDMPANLSLLAQSLSGRGYDVRLTRSPVFALRSIPFSQPDLILLDICMPEMDGYEVCEQLKADDRTSEIPIIFISALDSPLDKVKAFEVGGVDYVAKPFEMVEVLARVETHLRLQEQKARLQLEIQERQQAEMESSLMLMATQAIEVAENVSSAIATLLSPICEILECDLAEAWKPSANGKTFERISNACCNPSSCPIARLSEPQFFSADSFFGQVRDSGQLQWLEDLSLYPEFKQIDLQIEAVLGVPILSKQEVVAILIFYHHKPRTRKDNLLEAIASIARQLGFLVERKRAEAAQRLAEQKYQNIFENAIDGIFQSSVDRRFISVNPALARIYGYDSAEELMESITDIAEQIYVDPQAYRQFVAATNKREGVSGFEALVYRRDGRKIWIAETGRAVRDGSGNVLYYEGTVADITERKRIEEALQDQKAQTERLLLNILPHSIAQRLKNGESPIADYFEEVSILFADIVGFTEFAARKTPVELVEILSEIFYEFDTLAERLGLEKIKTIGDNYMVVGGLPSPHPSHANAIAHMALAMQATIAQYNQETGQNFQLRIGINLGSAIAGVMGQSKILYDLWGDAVNTASRMESTGMAGKIQVSASVYERLKERFYFEKRGEVQVRGKGKMLTYWLVGC
ncbi:adenylate/guanylate cyclase domain-containing protein [Oscillatoria sp. FACHB-1406]|uniref:adenylate/guanylate cyclase domain-containing protein n=1 Tax=Oscillatoria sp. FACHB-1406 TaxID=2692846 RepID=UPI001683D197|nr:adenylate/guanylate cyclase domain-containing protein [Oscillatoria sp. FACHB-1406]MBD2579979.1 response regulator [Oscillatoria sp. FACHB-1406]